MTDAQIGLVVTTPIIIIFALALRRMGVLRTASMATAVVASVAIATVLYLTQ